MGPAGVIRETPPTGSRSTAPDRKSGQRAGRFLELSPARVSEQRRVQGRRRVRTDAIDLEAITALVLAGHGVPVTARAVAVTELTGWAMHRGRRVQTRTATKNQLLA